MNDGWQDLQQRVQVGNGIRYWSKTRGYTYGTFVITAVESTSVSFTIPSGESLTVTKRDYEQTAPRLDDYLAGIISSDEVLEQSGRSAYIFSLVRMLRNAAEQVVFGDLLSAQTRVFLKSEFAPISNEWPAVSFTNEAPAKAFSGGFDPVHDFVIFAGTQTNDTSSAHKARLMSAARLTGSVVDSRLVIPLKNLSLFQGTNANRYIWSIQATEAWEFVDLPSARQLVGPKYKVLGLGRARQEGIQLSPSELEGLRKLRIRPILLRVVQTQDLETESSDESISGQLAHILAALRSRAQQGGSVVKRIAPLRICKLTMRDLEQMWRSQDGRCNLCKGPMPNSRSNILLQVSADRLDSSNPNYDVANTQLTHLGCNLGKNAATEEDFAAWLCVIRG